MGEVEGSLSAIYQRVLDEELGLPLPRGHPALLDSFWVLTRGGLAGGVAQRAVENCTLRQEAAVT